MSETVDTTWPGGDLVPSRSAAGAPAAPAARAGARTAPGPLAFFGHDAGESANRRRAAAFEADGVDVVGFMMRRSDPVDTPWPNVDLGRTADGAFLQRLLRVITGARRAARDPRLAEARLLYARNLDMLLCAALARGFAGLDTPMVYECLDVHRLTTRRDPLGMAMRWLEGRLLARCAGLVVSSPGFLRHHFERHHAGRYTAHLLENGLVAGPDLPERPSAKTVPADRPLRVGYVGKLRCQRSIDLLVGVADVLGPAVEIHLHGVPARREVRRFETAFEGRANIVHHGPYRWPADLAKVYGGVDVVWAGDFMEAGQNSDWLLPNRLYEGGYFVTPPLAPAGTETANWIATRGAGFVLAEPLEETLPASLARLAADRAPVARASAELAALPDTVFLQPPGALGDLVARIVAEAARA